MFTVGDVVQVIADDKYFKAGDTYIVAGIFPSGTVDHHDRITIDPPRPGYESERWKASRFSLQGPIGFPGVSGHTGLGKTSMLKQSINKPSTPAPVQAVQPVSVIGSLITIPPAKNGCQCAALVCGGNHRAGCPAEKK